MFAFEGVALLAADGLALLAFEGLALLAADGLAMFAFEGVALLAADGLALLAFEGLALLAAEGLAVFAFEGLVLLAADGLNSVLVLDGLAVSLSAAVLQIEEGGMRCASSVTAELTNQPIIAALSNGEFCVTPVIFLTSFNTF